MPAFFALTKEKTIIKLCYNLFFPCSLEFISLRFVLNNNFKKLILSVIGLCLISIYSCLDPSAPYESLEADWRAYEDSLQGVFFIPNQENLDNHQSHLEDFLSEIQSAKKHRGHDSRFDSLQLVVVEASQKYGRWYFDLEKYRIDNFLNEELDSTLLKERLLQVPIFLESGKMVLQKENLSNIDQHLTHQIDSYQFLIKHSRTLGIEGENARLAIKGFIAFLKSAKNNKPIDLEKIKNSR